jgi:tRNA threonylcarbamoyl adenosine modification protein YeaZ
MKILAFEFSTAQRSVAALNLDSASGLHSGEVVESLDASGGPLGMAAAALNEAGLEREQIECIAVGLGPGSYTGVRSAIALAQGWHLARKVRLVGIGSVECIVAEALEQGLQGRVTVVIDAQRGEFYLANYGLSAGQAKESRPLRLAGLDEARACATAGELLIGPEATKWFPAGRIVLPRAIRLARLAAGRQDFLAPADLEPIYLRATTFVKAPTPRNF